MHQLPLVRAEVLVAAGHMAVRAAVEHPAKEMRAGIPQLGAAAAVAAQELPEAMAYPIQQALEEPGLHLAHLVEHMRAVAAAGVAIQVRLAGQVAAAAAQPIQHQQKELLALLTRAVAVAVQVLHLTQTSMVRAVAVAASFGYGIQIAILPRQQQDHRPLQ